MPVCPHCHARLASEEVQSHLCLSGAPDTSPTEDSSPAPGLPPAWRTVSGSSQPTVTLRAPAADPSHPVNMQTPTRTLAADDDNSAGDEADYKIISYTAEGSMGQVFLARQNSMQRIVAVKQLKSELGVDERHRQKFLAEAAVTGELDHPNIVPVHDLGVSQEGQLFYSMKMIRGQSWQTEIKPKRQSENLEILMRVADGVAYAHSKNVIHRDLKPENIMLGRFGEVLVTDWGVAVYLDEDRNFGLAGTPAYMAPEMVSGPPEALCKQSDVYLLGAILFEIVVGVAPHHLSGSTEEVLIRAAANEIVATDIQDELLTIAQRAMATKPTSRYGSVEQFQDALRAYQQHTESLILLSRAEAELADAQRNKRPESFSRALFGFEEAIKLWSGNTRAYAAQHEAKLAYAEHALQSENYELGVSLLDSEDPRDAPLLKKLAQGKKERDLKTRRLRLARITTRALAGVLVAVLSIATLWIKTAKDKVDEEMQKVDRLNVSLSHSKAELQTEKDNLVDANLQISQEQEKLKQANVSLLQKNRQIQEARDLAQSRESAALEGQFISEVALIKSRISDNEVSQPRRQLAALRANPALQKYCDWEWDRLHYLCHPETASLPTAGGPQAAMGASRDGSLLARITRDGSVLQVWHRDDQGRLTAGPSTAVAGLVPRALALSSDNRLLAVGGSYRGDRQADPVVAIYRVTAEQLVAEITISAKDFWQVAGDGSASQRRGNVASLDFYAGEVPWLVVAGDSPHAVVYHRPAGEDWQVLQKIPHWGIVREARFAVDGSAVVTVNRSQQPQRQGVHVWPIAAGQIALREMRFLPGSFTTAVCDPLRTGTIACGQQDGRIRFWQWQQEPTSSTVLNGHEVAIRALAFSPSGERLVTTGDDRLLKIWRRNTTSQRPDEAGPIDGSGWRADQKFPPLRGHELPVIRCQFLDEHNLISLDRIAQIFNGSSSPPVSGDRAVGLGTLPPTQPRGGRTRIWDLRRYFDQLTLLHDQTRQPCYRASFSPQSKLLATAGADGAIWLWRGPDADRPGSPAAGPAYVGHPRRPPGKFFAQPIRLPGRDTPGIATLMSADPRQNQRKLDASLCFWDVGAGKFLLQQPVDRMNYFASSGDQAIAVLGRSIAPASVAFWELSQPAALVCRQRGQVDYLTTLAALRPASEQAFLGMLNEQGKLVSLSAPNVLRTETIKNMPDDLTAAAFTADGKWLLTIQQEGRTNRVLCTACETGRRVGSLSLADGISFHLDVAQGKATNRAVVLSHPRGVKVGHADSQLTMLQIDAGRLTQLRTFTGPFIHASLSPDGDTVLALRRRDSGHIELVELRDDQQITHPLSAAIARTSPEGLRFLDPQRLLTHGINRYGRPAVHVWNLAAGTEQARMTSGSAVVCTRLGLNRLVSVGRNGVVYLWDLTELERPVLKRQIVARGIANVRRAAISPDGATAVLIDTSGIAAVVDVPQGTVQRVGVDQRALDADCSSGQTAILCADGRIWLREGESNGGWLEKPQQLAGQQGGPTAKLLRLSTDGKALAARLGNQLVLWQQTDSGDWQGPLVAGNMGSQATALVFSASKQRLITGDASGSLRVLQVRWPATSGAGLASKLQLRELFSWKGHKTKVLSLDFSPAGRHLVSTSEQGQAVVWPSLPQPAPHGEYPVAKTGSSTRRLGDAQ